MRFLAIGEGMVEMAPDGAGKFSMNYAGDTMNTAWYLRRLLGPEHDIAFLTAVGEDEISDRMVEFIAASGIDTSEIARIGNRSVGLYLILLTNGERRFSYWRGQSAAKLLIQDRTALPAAKGDLVYFSGITLAILSETDRDHFLSLIKAARDAGATIAFDPNMRPRLWPSPTIMLHEIMRGAALADIVLPSADEEMVHAGDASPDATRDRYLKNGATTVVVKNGPGRMAGADPSGRLSFEPAAIAAPKDTTAAGDSFNAGFLAAYMTGADLKTAMAEGARVAGHVVQHFGALVDVTQT